MKDANWQQIFVVWLHLALAPTHNRILPRPSQSLVLVLGLGLVDWQRGRVVLINLISRS